MKNRFLPLAAFALMLFQTTQAKAEGFAVGARVSTLGLGGEVVTGILPNLNLRVGLNRFTYNHSGEQSDVDYDIDLELDSWNALVDFYILGGTFHLTGGFLLNNNNGLKLKAESLNPGETYEIGGQDFNGRQLGTLRGSVDFDSTALYAGIGWGNPVNAGWLFSVNFDLGVVLQGSPNVELNSTGGIVSDDPNFKNLLEMEESELEDDSDWFTVYPVLSLGVSFHF